jgi:hypothetical protein
VNQDVFYVMLVPSDVGLGQPVKRYFVNGQQVAARYQDGVYYTLNDPTGVSGAITDENGELVGRLLYDGFGAVLTNTVPVSRTSILPNLPDAASGLVHLGDGRWYDPAWGRPLQPNTDTNLPTIPQALNRFTAAPVGQPGIFQAESSGFNPFTNDYTSNFGKGVFSSRVNHAAVQGLRRYYKSSLHTVMGDPIIEIVNKAVPKSEIAEKALFGIGTAGFLVGEWVPDSVSNFGRKLFRRAVALNTKSVTDEIIIGYGFSYEHRLPAGRLVGKLFTTKLGAKLGLNVIDASIGFAVDVGYQILLDYDNPYLTNKQILQRAFIGQGLGSLVSFAGGSLVGWAFTGPVGFLVGVGISIAWDIWVAPGIYEARGAVPTRHLAQLLDIQ